MQGQDILLLVESLANEKNISQESVFRALEQALEVASRRKVGRFANIRILIDRLTGEYKTYEVELKDEDILYDYDTFNDIPNEFLSFSEAENVELDRIAIQSARNALHQKLTDAEKSAQVSNMSHRIDTLLSLKVAKVYDRHYLLTNIDDLSFILEKSQSLPGDSFRVGDKIKVLFSEIKTTKRGNNFYVSRTADNFLRELMRVEIPEINEGIIQVKSIARQPGVRAKVAVKTNDRRIDPIGACIGMRGMRIQAISTILMGERIDVIEWSDDLPQLVVNAMTPAKINSLSIEELNGKKTIKLMLDNDQHAQSVGKNGSNVNLVSRLIGCNIEILSEDMAKKNTNNLTENFAYLLDIDFALAKEIIDAGFDTIESISDLTPSELVMMMESLSDDTATKIVSNATKYHELDQILKLNNLTKDVLARLVKNHITTVEMISDFAGDELAEALNIEDVGLLNDVITQSRKLLGVI